MRASKVVPERAAPKTITGLSKIELPHLGTVYLKHHTVKKFLSGCPREAYRRSCLGAQRDSTVLAEALAPTRSSPHLGE